MLTTNFLLKQRYRILAKVGEGGFGVVYKAEDSQFGDRLVAVKEMSEEGLSPEEVAEAAQSFKNEIFLLAGLVHPNLPSIYDYFTAQSHWYVVMDFIEGETLENHLNKASQGYLSVQEALDIGMQLCSVLDYLHTRNPPIIFRDLKPVNIMLTPGSSVYLIDFGVARHFKPGKARDTSAFGSPGYAAPEQYGKAQTTRHADIYSLGVTLYQLLSGIDPTTKPFQFAPLQTCSAQAVPEELSALVLRMMELDESKRPDTMVMVKQQLQHIAVGLAAGQVGSIKPVSLPGNVVSRTQSTAPPIQAPIALPAWGKLLVTYREHTALIRSLAWSPNGEYIASAGEDCIVRVWQAGAGGGTRFRYTNHSEWVYAVAWSPDGKRIASASGDHTVQVWDPATNQNWFKKFALYTGLQAVVSRGHTSAVHSVTWSPDGQYIASASNDNTVRVWEVATGNTLVVLRHSDIAWSVQWSPYGTYVASASKDHTVRIWDAISGGNIQVLRTSPTVSYAVAWSPDGKRILLGLGDHTAQIWAVASGRKLLTYRGHADRVYSVSWSPDGSRIASGGSDRTVQVWEAATGKLTFTYQCNSSAMRAVAWSPDGQRLAYVSYDHMVDVWQVM
jgi:eukaryotic-like serine/threonine-protein kinase